MSVHKDLRGVFKPTVVSNGSALAECCNLTFNAPKWLTDRIFEWEWSYSTLFLTLRETDSINVYDWFMKNRGNSVYTGLEYNKSPTELVVIAFDELVRVGAPALMVRNDTLIVQSTCAFIRKGKK